MLPFDGSFHVKEGASKLERVNYKQFAFDTVPMTKDALGTQHRAVPG